jgi:hypothetical protein
MQLKYILIFLIPFLLLSLYGGCSKDGGGDQDTLNRCFSDMSSNPCFDPNEGGSSSTVDDKTVDEVIEEQENRQDFLGQLDINEIVRTLGRSIFLPDLPAECMWEDSGLVIKTQEDWNRYRTNCYFQGNFFEPPDVNYVDNMVIISLNGFRGFGTEVVAVLEFDFELVAVITDTVSDASSSEAKFFGSSVVEVERKELPVSFIRVEEICNTVFNLSNAECLAESMINSCEGLFCTFNGGRTGIFDPNCTALDCTSVQCQDFGMNFSEVVMGTITDLEVGESLFPNGIINLGDGDREVGCGIVVE